MRSPEYISKTFVNCLQQANRKSIGWKVQWLSKEAGWLRRWEQLLLGPWWGYYIVPLILLLLWAVLAFLVRFSKNVWVILAYLVLGFTLPIIISLLQTRIITRTPSSIIRWSETIFCYRKRTGCEPEEAVPDLQRAIRYYETKSKRVLQFITLAASFLMGCLTSGDLRNALFRLLQATLLAPPDILRAATEVFQANPIGTIVFGISLTTWVWHYPRIFRILWMKQAVINMKLPE